MSIFISLICGLLFSIGLSLSGMVNPLKVKGFLNIFDNWDPTLLFVMCGAISINLIFYPIIKKRGATYFNKKIDYPTSKVIDKRLIIGSSLFGIGWGITGICPGPAISNLFLFNPSIILFTISMITGMTLFNITKKP